MAEGTGTFMGMAPPILGEYEQKQQTAATDMVTLTGAASMSGDFLVCQNSTGTEQLVISSSGLITSAAGLSISGVISVALASSNVNAVTVNVTSTGAIAQGAESPVAFLVQASSKSVLDAAFAYHSGGGAEAEVGTCNALIATYGSKAPTYFLSVNATGGSLKGAAADIGCFVGATTLQAVSDITSSTEFSYIKVTNGSAIFHLLALPATGMA